MSDATDDLRLAESLVRAAMDRLDGAHELVARHMNAMSMPALKVAAALEKAEAARRSLALEARARKAST